MVAPVGSARLHGHRDDGATDYPTDHPCTYRSEYIVSVSIKPLEDRILVQTLEAEQTTASGLVIPDTAKEKPQEGKVLAVGPGRFDEDGDKATLGERPGDDLGSDLSGKCDGWWRVDSTDAARGGPRWRR
jgi:co-chaperonin GroES (HSP10)